MSKDGFGITRGRIMLLLSGIQQDREGSAVRRLPSYGKPKRQKRLWLSSSFLRKATLTCNKLQKRGWQRPSKCTLCASVGENLQHEYPLVRHIWNLFSTLYYQEVFNSSFWEIRKRGGWYDVECLLRCNTLTSIIWNVRLDLNNKIF